MNGRRYILWFFSRWYVATIAAWLVRYATLGNIRFWQQPVWANWYDQSRYLASAKGFASGDLSAAVHWYPFGYSLLAAPFAWIVPADPFFVLDGLLYLLACKAFQHVAGRLDIGPWTATLCFVATTLIQSGLASGWVHPWTTTLSAAMIWWLAHVTLTVAEGETERATLLSFGGLTGGLPLVRPLDGLIAITCLAAIGVTLIHQRRLSARAMLIVAAGGGTVVGAYAVLHWAIYGLRPTEYMIGSAHVGFVLNDIGWKAYVLLVNAHEWFSGTDSILQRLPWIVPGCAGLLTAAIVGSYRVRRTPLLLLALMFPVSAIMLTFADLLPPGLWRFGNIHYFKWLMPAFGLGLLLCWRQLQTSRGRTVLAVASLALTAPLLLRLTPRRVNAQTPARMLMFSDPARRRWDEAYFSLVRIDDDQGRLHSPGEFHQIPDEHGERAIALTRLFGGDPRRHDPGEAVRADPRPYARYREQLTIGW